MRPGGGDGEAVVRGDARSGAAQLPQRRHRLVGVGADAGGELDDGRVHLRLQRAGEIELRRAAQEDVDGGRRLQRGRVEDHHLFLDADRERTRLAEVGFDQGAYFERRMPWTGRPAASHA